MIYSGRLQFYKDSLALVQDELEFRKRYNSPSILLQDLSTETLEDDMFYFTQAIESLESGKDNQ